MDYTTPAGVPVTREAIRVLMAEAEAERDPARYALLMQNYRIAAAEALPALLDALDAAERNRDDAMIRAAEDQDEHSAQRAALAAEVERLRAVSAADEETMRLLYDDVEQARGQVERLRADITAARDIAATRGGVPGRGYAESAVDTATWLVEALEEARADLAEARLRLAIWSGECVPAGWEAAADGEPYLVRRRGEWAVTLDPAAGGGAVWSGWWRLDECERCEEREYQRTATATEALAAAEAWLARVAP